MGDGDAALQPSDMTVELDCATLIHGGVRLGDLAVRDRDAAWARCAHRSPTRRWRIRRRPSCQPPVGLLTRRAEMPLDVSVCSKLCGVAEQSSANVPARDPDRLIKWFIGVVVIGVGVNLLSSFVVAQKWAWLPPAVFVAALLVAVPSTGLLRRERYGTTRARAMALLALSGLSGGHGVGIGDWVAPCRDDLVRGVPLGGWGDAHLADPPKSRGLRPCRRGDSLFACRFGVLAARDREPAGCMDAGHGRGCGG